MKPIANAIIDLRLVYILGLHWIRGRIIGVHDPRYN